MRIASAHLFGSLIAPVVYAFHLAVPVAAQAPAQCGDSLRLAAMDLSTIDADMGRMLQTVGAMPLGMALVRRGSTERAVPLCPSRAPWLGWAVHTSLPAAGGLKIQALPAAVDVGSRSGYRRDRNNGALRGTVGPSMEVAGGLEALWKGFSLALAPRLIYEANGEFRTLSPPTASRHPLANPYHGSIDLPQRFGTAAEGRLDPGQSYLRWGNKRAEGGVATENVILGAQHLFPILLSTTAGGFPHAFAGTVAPLDLRIVRVGAHAIWGRVEESDYFDGNEENDARLFAASVLEFSSPWIPGLHVGIARVYHEIIPPEGLSFGYWLGSVVESSPFFTGGGNRFDGNGIGALLARWVLPDQGFEAYAEWSREDTPLDLRDLIEEPDWTQAYALGFQQVVELDDVRLHWYGELVHLGQSAPVRAGKGFFTYYTHGRVIQGHTHGGQLLGAAPGPGSDAQTLGLDVFHGLGMTGLWLERTRADEDTYYERWARIYGESRHDVEIAIGARHLQNVGPLQVGADVVYASRVNRSFLNLAERGERLVENSLGFGLRAVWRP